MTVSPDAVIVDLGGVLVQWRDFSERDAWAARHGMTGEELFDRWFEAVGPGWEGGRGEPEIHRRLLESCGVGDDELPHLLRVLHAHEALEPQLAEFLRRARPRYRTGVITNAGPSARAAMREKFALDELVDVIVVSAEEGCSKPDARIYRTAAERLGVAPSACVFVDDKASCVEGARRAGMVGIRFDSIDQAVRDMRAALGVTEVQYVAAGGVVVDADRVLLLGRPSRDEVRIPKGHVEAGETVEQAALREVGEESGYVDLVVEADLGEQLADFDVFPAGEPGTHVVRTERYFRMSLRSDRQAQRHERELDFVPFWVPTAEAAAVLTYEVEREWVRRAVDSA